MLFPVYQPLVGGRLAAMRRHAEGHFAHCLGWSSFKGFPMSLAFGDPAPGLHIAKPARAPFCGNRCPSLGIRFFLQEPSGSPFQQ